MNLSIGFRTLKTAIGVTLAITVAQLFQLHNFATAGILTILCIQQTKKQSLVTSRNRFFGAFLTIAICYVLFEGIAFQPILVGVMLLIYIPIAVAFKMADTVVTSGVIGLHLYSFGRIDWSIVWNEISIVSIGIIIALLVNIFMPSVDSKLKDNTLQIEKNIKEIVMQISRYLKTNNQDWSGIEFLKTEELIIQSKRLSQIDTENKLFTNANSHYHYFDFCHRQLQTLERVLPYAAIVPNTIVQSTIVADFLEEVARNIHGKNSIDQFLPRLNEMRASFQEMELPKTREEFEVRASLFHLVREIEQFLLMKKSLKDSSYTGAHI